LPGQPEVANVIGPVAEGSLLTIAQAPAWSMGMLDVAMTNSLSIAMGNAVANQQRGQVLAQAALTQVLTLIITKGASGT